MLQPKRDEQRDEQCDVSSATCWQNLGCFETTYADWQGLPVDLTWRFQERQANVHSFCRPREALCDHKI